tara:strand:+ start:2515 stop:2862 length:348 start_codon:yes stop_codon:yes gene_type:complete
MDDQAPWLSGSTSSEQHEWESLCFELEMWMDGQEHWHAQMENFGWRKLNGEKTFRATNGAVLLFSVLPPNTSCQFNIFKDPEEELIRIQNFHHDSNTGDEVYEIRPATEEEIASC